jgi:hypothetical protein
MIPHSAPEASKPKTFPPILRPPYQWRRTVLYCGWGYTLSYWWRPVKTGGRPAAEAVPSIRWPSGSAVAPTHRLRLCPPLRPCGDGTGSGGGGGSGEGLGRVGVDCLCCPPAVALATPAVSTLERSGGGSRGKPPNRFTPTNSQSSPYVAATKRSWCSASALICRTRSTDSRQRLAIVVGVSSL